MTTPASAVAAVAVLLLAASAHALFQDEVAPEDAGQPVFQDEIHRVRVCLGLFPMC